MKKTIAKSVLYGLVASLILLAVYFAVLTLVSGWSFATEQFSDSWYFIVSLALGFGVQIGLYAYLRSLIRGDTSLREESPRKGGYGEGGIVGVTGTTSTAAMISCCTHYLANLLPILGIAGVVTFVTRYQVELFWVGLLFNFLGILYITNRIIRFRKQT